MTYSIYGLSQKCFVNQSQEKRAAPSKFQKIASRAAPVVDAAIIGLSLTLATLIALRGGAHLNLGPINALGGLGWYPAPALMGLSLVIVASDAITLAFSCRKPKPTKADREAVRAKRGEQRAQKEDFAIKPKERIAYLSGPRKEKTPPRAAVIDLASSKPVELKRVLKANQKKLAESGPFVGIDENRQLVLVSLTKETSDKKAKEGVKYTPIGIYPNKSERGEQSHLLIFESADGSELQGLLVTKEVADQLFNIPVADEGKTNPTDYKPFVADGATLYTIGKTLTNESVQRGEIVIGFEGEEVFIGAPLMFQQVAPKKKKKKDPGSPPKEPEFQLMFDTSLSGKALKKA